MTTALAAGVAAGVLGLAGCSSGSSGSSGSVGASTPTPAPGATGAPVSTATDAPASRVVTFAAPGRPSGTVSVGFVSLRLDGRLANLTLTLTPHFPGTPTTEEISIFHMFSDSAPDVSLVDTTNLKRYVVVRDSASQQLESDVVSTRTTNDRPVTTSYTFAAPPGSVRAIDLYVNDRRLFDNVPVGR